MASGPSFGYMKPPNPTHHQRIQTKVATQRGETLENERGGHIRHPTKPPKRPRGDAKPQPTNGHFVTIAGRPVFIPDDRDA